MLGEYGTVVCAYCKYSLLLTCSSFLLEKRGGGENISTLPPPNASSSHIDIVFKLGYSFLHHRHHLLLLFLLIAGSLLDVIISGYWLDRLTTIKRGGVSVVS